VETDSIDIAAGLDALWVANLEDGTISRIDAELLHVLILPDFERAKIGEFWGNPQTPSPSS